MSPSGGTTTVVDFAVQIVGRGQRIVIQHLIVVYIVDVNRLIHQVNRIVGVYGNADQTADRSDPGVALRVVDVHLEGARADLHAVDEDVDAVITRRKSTGVLQMELDGRRAVEVHFLFRVEDVVDGEQLLLAASGREQEQQKDGREAAAMTHALV